MACVVRDPIYQSGSHGGLVTHELTSHPSASGDVEDMFVYEVTMGTKVFDSICQPHQPDSLVVERPSSCLIPSSSHKLKLSISRRNRP